MKLQRDWIGHIVIIPNQHSLIITNKWEKKDGYWWWKCNDCTESSGVMSTIELEKLDDKGMIVIPESDIKLPTEYSRHPKETEYNKYPNLYYDYD